MFLTEHEKQIEKAGIDGLKKLVLMCAIITLCIVLTACVSADTMLVNSNGQRARCSANGFGIIGSMVASSNHEDCVKKYEAAGYKK